MLKRTLTFALAGSVLSVLLLPPPGVAAQTAKDAPFKENIKANVEAIGVGARVAIKLQNKKELTGYITSVGTDDFVITKAKEGGKQTVAFADVVQVKQKNEKRISTAGKILIVMGVLTILSLIGNHGFGG